MLNGTVRKYTIFMILWCIPTVTPIYILLHDIWGWSIVNAYIVANLISGTLVFAGWAKITQKIEQKLEKML